MFDQETIAAITRAAEDARLEPAALLAVTDVESAGKAFADVEGRREPIIRFEGHYFDRRLTGRNQAEARAAGLASTRAGGVANPRSQAGRWALLERACAFDRRAAYESVSWGLGQVMGAHWLWLGYPSVDALVAEARSGVEGQAALMIRYIDRSGLRSALERQDWAAFARGYNGPGYRKYGYDAKIAAAYERHRNATGAKGKELPERQHGTALRRGDHGAAISELQTLLSAAGHRCAVDGIFGKATEAALREFQLKSGCAPDGLAGPQTLSELRNRLPVKVPALPTWLRLGAWLAGLLGRA